MIIPCRIPPPSFLKTVFALGYFFAQFSDHLGSQVHPETNFGKSMRMADITLFNKLEVRGEIYRHKYVKVCMKYGVWSEYKVCFRAFYSQTGRFGALQKNNLRGCDHQPATPHSSQLLTDPV